MARGRLPSRKYTQKKGRTENITEGLVVYMELAKAARLVLINDGRMNDVPLLDFKLQNEAKFCMNLLLNICKVTKAYIVSVQQTVHDDAKKFEKEANNFADSIIPKTEKDFKLYSYGDLKKQIIAEGQRKKMNEKVKGGGNVLLVPR